MSKSPIVYRSMAAVLATVLKQYPIVSITGPRQSGKTTLCHLVGQGYRYVNLEIQENREFARKDPGQFLEQYQNGVILDEVQAVPELFPYLQYLTDKRKCITDGICIAWSCCTFFNKQKNTGWQN